MTTALNNTVTKLNRIKSGTFLLAGAIVMCRAFIIALLFAAFWGHVRPGADIEQLVLTFLTFIFGLGLSTIKRSPPIQKKDLLMSLEMKHPGKRNAAFKLNKTYFDNAVELEWQAELSQELKVLRGFERRRIGRMASTLVLPFLFLILTLTSSPTSLSKAIDNVQKVVSILSRGASLKVVSGRASEAVPELFTLSTTSLSRVELLSQNMIELELNTGARVEGAPRIVELRRRDENGEEKTFQTFQMNPIRTSKEKFSGKYRIAFAVSEDLDLYIPFLSASKPLAQLLVKQLPVPKVRLAVTSQIEKPWPDDRPLGLKIDVKAENPLQLIRLVIRSGKRQSQELVNKIMASDLHKVSTDYQLLLEPYVETDIAEVEIVAEAIDRAVPNPLIGQSNPIRLTTASAYGRYRQTLQTLRALKSITDEALTAKSSKLPEEAKETLAKARKQAENSPFFDGLDRVKINNFNSSVQRLTRQESAAELMELSSDLNEFLFEHEILDDRERDRDFFVAVRGLSRLVEQDRNARPVEVPIVTDRIKEFLTGRHERWEIRVNRLSRELQPKSWPNVSRNKPFKEAMDKIATLDGQGSEQANSAILIELSKVATDYRVWIEELEAAEDDERARQEKMRQQGLANARNQLRDLQKRQGRISQKLDRADLQSKRDLEDGWPSTRMDQNENIKGTKRLEAQMRSLSPQAGERIKAAVQAMQVTNESGNEQNFVQAESASDMAGRLLRQADSAAQRSQRQKGNSRRRRRVTGDRYYGQRVIGGDVEFKRDYQVDRRYREDILDEVRQSISNQGGEDSSQRRVLENYLRQIVR